MSKIENYQTNFISGILSSENSGTVESREYNNGAKDLKNVNITNKGGVSQRGGFDFKYNLVNSDSYKVFHFNIHNTDYICVIGINYFKVLDINYAPYNIPITGNTATGDLVTSGSLDKELRITKSNNIYTSSDYDASSWFRGITDKLNIHYTVAEDKVILTHPNIPPCEIVRSSNNLLELRRIYFDFEFVETDYNKLVQAGVTANRFDLGAFVYNAGSSRYADVYKPFQYSSNTTITQNTVHEPLKVRNGVILSVSIIAGQQVETKGIAYNLENISGVYNSSRPIKSYIVKESPSYKFLPYVKASDFGFRDRTLKWDGYPKQVLNTSRTYNESYEQYHYFAPLYNWRNGNFPAKSIFYQNRLIFYNQSLYPNRIWVSSIGDTYNFLENTDNRTTGFYLDLQDAGGAIENIIVNNRFTIFTREKEFIANQDVSVPMTPSTFSVSSVSEIGSKIGSKVHVNDGNIVFVSRDNSIKYFSYNDVRKDYNPKTLSSNVFSNINEIKNSVTIVRSYTGFSQVSYFQTSDDTIYCLFFDSESNLMSWTYYTIQGKIVDMFSAKGLLSLVVQRTVDSITTATIEEYNPLSSMDCSLSLSGLTTQTVENNDLNVFLGRSPAISHKNKKVGNFLIRNNADTNIKYVTLNEIISDISIGFEYDVNIETLPVIPLKKGVTRINRLRRVINCDVDYYNTSDFNVSTDGYTHTVKSINPNIFLDPFSYSMSTDIDKIYLCGNYTYKPSVSITKKSIGHLFIKGLYVNVSGGYL